MKKHTIILLSLLLLTGCANSTGSIAPEQPTNEIPDVVFTEAAEIPPDTSDDTFDPFDARAIATREIFSEHFRQGDHLRLPSNYQGAYLDGSDFVIQVSNDDYSDYDFLSELEFARIETVKYTKKELETVQDISWDILRDEHGIDVVSSGMDHKNNAIGFEIFDCYTDEEKAEIASYVADYPVTITYVNYHNVTQTAPR